MGTNQLAICPVMKLPIDKNIAEKKGLMREYNGKKYFLCCVGCGPLFDKDPATYAENQSSN